MCKFGRLHPFFFVVVSLLFVYTGARLIASPVQLLRPLLILWGILILLYPVCRRLAGGADWGAILLSVFVFGFCFPKSQFVRVGLLVILVVAATALCLFLLKRPVRVRHVSLSLAAVGFSIALIQIVSLLAILRAIPSSYFANMEARSGSLALPLSITDQGTPDIYYIILDGYPRQDVLREIYQFDNTEFIEEITDLGFVVPQNAHSNYSRTAISVSTTLDMQYWDAISPGMEEAVYWWLVEPVMDRNRLRASLETIGYQYVSIATDWGITDNPSADIHLKPYPFVLSDYENYLLSVTPLRFLYAPLQRFAPIITAEVHREYIRFNLDALQRGFDIPSPKFVFSHIIVPHPPFVFDSDGNPINTDASFTFNSPDATLFSKQEYKENYIAQIRYINSKILQVIHALLENSSVPPVIVIQADHGSAMYVDFENLEASCLKERFSVFAAYYLPGASPDSIPSDISAVNIFRIVLDQYFDARLELLDDRQYFMNGYFLFDLQDVTDRVGAPCAIPAQP